MKNTSNFLLRKGLFLSAIFFLTFVFSCKKDGKLTPDFENGNLSINFTDTFSIATTLIQEDSLRTDLSNVNMLGLFNDPIFGLVSSSIYTDVLLTGVNVDFGAGAVFDSIVLTLDYLGAYGDTATPITVNVFELNTMLDANSDYYSNTYVSHNSTPLGTLSFTPNLLDSVNLVFDTITRESHIRVKLNNTFGQSIMNADVNGSNDLASNATFRSFMNGLYITTTDSVSNSSLLSGAGSIASFNLNSSLSTLTVYYNDSLSYDFTINAEGVNFSRFAHNYIGTDIEAHLNSLPSKNIAVTYISTMAGVKTKVDLLTIKDLTKDDAVTINKAEIIFTLENGTEINPGDALQTLSLVGIDASGNAQFLPDFFEGTEHYGGILDDQGSFKTYTFNITRHIHQLVYNTTTDFGMFLVSNGATTVPNRSVIGSENSPISKIRLEITYSKL